MDSQSSVPPGTVLSLFALDQEEAFNSGVVVYQLRLQRTDNGWLAIVKGIHQGKHVVSFIGAEGFHRALFKLGTAVENDDVRWFPDKFPPKTLPAQLRLLG